MYNKSFSANRHTNKQTHDKYFEKGWELYVKILENAILTVIKTHKNLKFDYWDDEINSPKRNVVYSTNNHFYECRI